MLHVLVLKNNHQGLKYFIFESGISVSDDVLNHVMMTSLKVCCV